jgi:hypothetical protein
VPTSIREFEDYVNEDNEVVGDYGDDEEYQNWDRRGKRRSKRQRQTKPLKKKIKRDFQTGLPTQKNTAHI